MNSDTANANLDCNPDPRQDASESLKSKCAQLNEALAAMRPLGALDRTALRRNTVLTKALKVERPTGRFEPDPQGIVDMLWHHSKAHVSPDLFKRVLIRNNLCELIKCGAPQILYTDFNNALGMLTGSYRKKFGREPHFQELVALVLQIDDTTSSPEYDQKAHAFFEFWREWHRIEAPNSEHPECLSGVTVVKLAMTLWKHVRDDVDEDSFCQAMAGNQAAMKSIGWAQEYITETIAQIERHYLNGLHRKPFAIELEGIAGAAVARVESDEEREAHLTQKILDAMELDRMVMTPLPRDDAEEAED